MSRLLWMFFLVLLACVADIRPCRRIQIIAGIGPNASIRDSSAIGELLFALNPATIRSQHRHRLLDGSFHKKKYVGHSTSLADGRLSALPNKKQSSISHMVSTVGHGLQLKVESNSDTTMVAKKYNKHEAWLAAHIVGMICVGVGIFCACIYGMHAFRKKTLDSPFPARRQESSSSVVTSNGLTRLMSKAVAHRTAQPTACLNDDINEKVLPDYESYATLGALRGASIIVCALALFSLVSQVFRPTHSFSYSRWLFLRLFGALACSAFLSVRAQILGLMGRDGILPAADVADAVAKDPTVSLPLGTRFLLGNASDNRLQALCLSGAMCGILVTFLDGVIVPLPGLVSFVPCLCLLACHSLYSTITIAGRQWFRLQWDSLLSETSFLAAILALPSICGIVLHARWLMILLLFRLMLGSGIVKLASSDPYWQSLRAMDYHYLTQPLPARGARLAHLYQGRLTSKLSCAYSLLVELIGPLLFFGGPIARMVGFGLQASLQLGIAATGHYGFFNMLTLALCVLLLDDSQLSLIAPITEAGVPSKHLFWSTFFFVPSGWSNAGAFARNSVAIACNSCTWIFTITLALVQAVALSFAFNSRRGVRLAPPSWMLRVYKWWSRRFDIGSPYGLFATMTTKREEILIEGSNDELTWQAYGHRYKADADLTQGLKSVPPLHMPRLDWWLWFVPLGMRGEWIKSLCRQLLTPSASTSRNHVLNLFDPHKLPFPDPANPPKAIRMIAVEYTWAESGKGENGSSTYWVRKSEPRVIYQTRRKD